MGYSWRARLAVGLTVMLAALCLFARPTADCVAGRASFCAMEKLNVAVADIATPVSALPAAISAAAAAFAAVFFFSRPDLRVRIPVSAQVARVPWHDRFLPYVVAMRDP